jgi:hypothetical protein
MLLWCLTSSSYANPAKVSLLLSRWIPLLGPANATG